jgi:uncharacterized protein YecE (DUF72 family)
MAQTLAQFRTEFTALKKLVAESADEGENLEHNLSQRREMLQEGFKALGLRIHELRDTGAQGARLADFMRDREAAAMATELTRHRDAAKVDAAKAVLLERNTYPAITSRMQTLRAGLTAEIGTRQGKFSSKKLRINQSVKEMAPLQTEVENYARAGNADYQFIANHTGSYAPDWYDRLYDDLADEELAKSKAVALSGEQQMMAKRLLDLKLMASTYNKAKAVYAEILKQAKLAEQAQKARKSQPLSDARKAADVAMAKTNALVDPYEKAMKDVQIAVLVSHSPDKDKVKRSYDNLLDVKSMVKAEFDEIKARRIKT